MSKVVFTSNATKVWLLSDGTVLLCRNKSKIPIKDLKLLLNNIQLNHTAIVNFWFSYFNYIKFIK